MNTLVRAVIKSSPKRQTDEAIRWEDDEPTILYIINACGCKISSVNKLDDRSDTEEEDEEVNAPLRFTQPMDPRDERGEKQSTPY
jgi:hypothetical protein